MNTKLRNTRKISGVNNKPWKRTCVLKLYQLSSLRTDTTLKKTQHKVKTMTQSIAIISHGSKVDLLLYNFWFIRKRIRLFAPLVP